MDFVFGNTCNSYSLHEIVKRKIKSLIIPLISWNIIMFILRGSNYAWNVFEYLKGNYNFLWFLWAVFYCSIITALVHRFARDSKIIFILIILSGFFYRDLFNSIVFKMMFPFFVLGYLANKYNVVDMIKGTRKQCLAVVAIFIGVYALFGRSYYISYWKVNGLYIENIIGVLGRWMVNLAGITMICFGAVSYRKYDNTIGGLLQKLGRKTMGIYIISVYACNYILTKVNFKWQEYIMLNIIYNIVMSIFVLILSYGFVLAIERFEVVRKLLFG